LRYNERNNYRHIECTNIISWAAVQLELLRREMENYRRDILGLAKMRWTDMGGDE